MTIGAIPLFAVGSSLPVIAGWGFAVHCFNKFTHSNVRTRLGPLRLVLVTPQSHRVHHSREPRHRDTNYGSVFSIWDRLFGTQHPCDDRYPETGIDDPRFEEWSGRRSVAAILRDQLAMPFRAPRTG